MLAEYIDNNLNLEHLSIANNDSAKSRITIKMTKSLIEIRDRASSTVLVSHQMQKRNKPLKNKIYQ